MIAIISVQFKLPCVQPLRTCKCFLEARDTLNNSCAWLIGMSVSRSPCKMRSGHVTRVATADAVSKTSLKPTFVKNDPNFSSDIRRSDANGLIKIRPLIGLLIGP